MIETPSSPVRCSAQRRTARGADGPLERLVRTTGAAHGSVLRHQLSRERLVVEAVAGVPIVGCGMRVPADRMDGAVSAWGCVPPVLAMLAQASGMTVTAGVPVVDTGHGTSGVVTLAWRAGEDAPSDDALLDAVEEVEPQLAALLGGGGTASVESVIVAHADELVAQGVARQVELQRNTRVRTCTTVDELEDLLAHAPASIVLCGDRLADDATLTEVTGRLRDQQPDARVVAIARTSAWACGGQARQAGVDGLAVLEDGPAHLVSILDAVAAGETVLPAGDEEETPPTLTTRELQLLRGLEQGLSYQQIALDLGLALSTVKTHSRPLFRKLGVSSRAAAVHRAREEGLI